MDINALNRTKIITLHQHTNKSKNEISRIVGVSRSSVGRIIKKFIVSENLESNRKGRCGRKTKAGPEAMQMLIRESEVHPRSTSTELRNYLESLGIQVTQTQIWSKCKAAN